MQNDLYYHCIKVHLWLFIPLNCKPFVLLEGKLHHSRKEIKAVIGIFPRECFNRMLTSFIFHNTL